MKTLKSSLLISLWTLAVLISSLVPRAHAASEWTQEATYEAKVEKKFRYGVENVLAGWTEVFTEPYERRHSTKDLITGLFVGIFNAVVDTVGGAVHLVTAPITQIDVPLPEDGVMLSHRRGYQYSEPTHSDYAAQPPEASSH